MKFLKSAIFALMLLLPLSCSGQAQPKAYQASIVRAYPHDGKSFTQGLFFHGDTLYESIGLKGRSRLMKVDLESGKAISQAKLGSKYFAEGSVVLDDKLYLLTWQNKVVFVYDPETLEHKMSYSYPREGWGLTTDGKSLIASDGSSKIYFLSPDLKLEKTLNVTLNGRAVRFLNELEWIDGKIWANVFLTDMIVVINPKTGVVEATVDCSGLLPESLRTGEEDVLNGIAVDSAGKIYVTGKNWPKLFEISLVKQRNSK